MFFAVGLACLLAVVDCTDIPVGAGFSEAAGLTGDFLIFGRPFCIRFFLVISNFLIVEW